MNCIESFTARLIYEHILYQLQDLDEEDDEFDPPPKCDNMTDFLRQLKNSLSSRQLTSETFYIVIDKAERLRDIEAKVLPAFLRLQELTQLNICVIFISQIVWEKFQVGTGFYEPLVVHFPDYSKMELLQIMAKDCPSSYPVEFYKAYCQLFMSVFYSVCRDLNELRHLVSMMIFVLKTRDSPTPTHGLASRYLVHTHSHITWAVAAMNSCFPCHGAYQGGIAIKPLIRGPLLHSGLLVRAGGRGGDHLWQL